MTRSPEQLGEVRERVDLLDFEASKQKLAEIHQAEAEEQAMTCVVVGRNCRTRSVLSRGGSGPRSLIMSALPGTRGMSPGVAPRRVGLAIADRQMRTLPLDQALPLLSAAWLDACSTGN